ncbi:MAG: SMC-Scp complex subunit ScpB [Cyclobacteriaceae bacterium]
MDVFHKHIESLIFCSQAPIKIEDISKCLKELFDADSNETSIIEAIHALQKKYASEEFSFEIIKVGGGYQFMTKPAFQESVSILLKQKSKRRLSNSALETLSIIAYKQPITKGEVEQIRGVNCDYSIQKLLEKELLEIKGKAQTVGKPLLYGTNDSFMEYFGINSIGDLPQPKDLLTDSSVNEIGETNEA